MGVLLSYTYLPTLLWILDKYTLRRRDTVPGLLAGYFEA